MSKTAQFIEETKEASGVSVKTPQESPKKKRGNPQNLVAPWPKGVSGNPGGRPKNDLAKEIAAAVFAENKEEIYKRMTKALFKGNAYAFDILAQRAFGKLKETKEVTHFYQDTADADLEQRIADLERDLGLARAIDEAGRTGISQAGAKATNGHAKD
jgi:hypothetical protein